MAVTKGVAWARRRVPNAKARPPFPAVLPLVVVLRSKQYVLSHAAMEHPRLLGDAGQRPVNRHDPSL